MQLAKNTVLITGGTSGIGYALAEAFMAAGSRVAICGRREDRLEDIQALYPDIMIRVCDLSKNDGCRELYSWATEKLPDLNVLINNAGIQRDISFVDGVDEYFTGENEIRVNLEAPIILSGMFIPLLRKNKNPAIINVTSGLGFVPAAKMPVYSATKAGLHSFSLSLRYQLKKIGLKVYEIVPPAVDTDLNPAGHAQRGGFKAGLSAADYVAGTMKALAKGEFEISFGPSEKWIRDSREELDKNFEILNSKM